MEMQTFETQRTTSVRFKKEHVICVCIYIYIYIHIYTYMHTCVRTYIRMRAYTHPHGHSNIHAPMRAQTHNMYIDLYMHWCVCVCVYVCLYVRVHVCVQVYAKVHACMDGWSCSCKRWNVQLPSGRAFALQKEARAGAVIGGRGLLGSTHDECCEKKSCHDWKCVST